MFTFPRFTSFMSLVFAATSLFLIFQLRDLQKLHAENEKYLEVVSKGEKFYLLREGGNCQEAKLRYAGGYRLHLGPTFVGEKSKSTDKTVVKPDGYLSFECVRSLEEALR